MGTNSKLLTEHEPQIDQQTKLKKNNQKKLEIKIKGHTIIETEKDSLNTTQQITKKGFQGNGVGTFSPTFSSLLLVLEFWLEGFIVCSSSNWMCSSTSIFLFQIQNKNQK